jgi:hypothetical protein
MAARFGRERRVRIKSRPQLSLNKDSPISRPVAVPNAGRLGSSPLASGGLHHYEHRAAYSTIDSVRAKQAIRSWGGRLFQLQNTRKPYRCQAMTVCGFTITSAARQSFHERDRHAHSHRSVFVRRSRGHDRCGTCSCGVARYAQGAEPRVTALDLTIDKGATNTNIIAD